MKTWIKDNAGSLLVAIIGFIGAVFGAYYGASSADNLWRREKAFQYENEIVDRRINIIKSIVRSHVAAQRVSSLKEIMVAEKIIENQLDDCKKIDYCVNSYSKSLHVNSAIKELADMQAEYFSNIVLSSIYFCDETRHVISKMQEQKKNWWEFSRQEQDYLVNSMLREVGCGINFIKEFS